MSSELSCVFHRWAPVKHKQPGCGNYHKTHFLMSEPVKPGRTGSGVHSTALFCISYVNYIHNKYLQAARVRGATREKEGYASFLKTAITQFQS